MSPKGWVKELGLSWTTSETRAHDIYQNEYAESKEFIKEHRLSGEVTEKYYYEYFQYPVIYTLLLCNSYYLLSKKSSLFIDFT